MHVSKNFLLLVLIFGVPTASAAEEHCMVTQAMALAGYEARMDLLVGTDEIFSSAYYDLKHAQKTISEKYSALFGARNKKGSENNPENHMASFSSPAEREAYFREWNRDIKALEAAQSSELNSISEVFDHAIEADPNLLTRRRVARINALWKKEFYAPCYWGEPK